ncbi:MAG: ShlB/FhaC/HecB family hemolysin secretion/activation protein [Rhizobiaceae bacterium]|nr:ShlB/FhaC/HecB family hemolysin secretion/activation protein [Rhizobiaceae bacterium]
MRPCIGIRAQRSGLALALVVAAACAGAAHAQQPPAGVDAGSLQGEADRVQQDLEDRVQPKPRDEADSVTGPPREAPPQIPGGGPTFLLTRVAFSESYFFTQEQLATIAAPFVGRTLDFAGIQALINAVNEQYAERGIITASATLPEQDLEGGVLRIELIEGRVGQVSVEGAARSADYVRSRVKLEPGTVVDVPRLGARVAAQNRTGEARVRTVLEPGTEFGRTDVTLSVTEPKRNVLDLFADNFGSPTTGRWQGGALFQHYGLLGVDDRFKLYGTYSGGNIAASASYTFGVTPSGGRLGLSYSYSRMRIIDGPFAGLDVGGGSQGGGANFAQPVFSNSDWLMLLNLGVNASTSATNQGGVPVTDNFTFKPSAGFTLNYYHPKLAVSFAPAYSYARTDMRVTGGLEQVHLFHGSLSATAVLPGELVLQGYGAWQVASQLLVPGDQLFQIGGPTSIRGYDANAAAGGSGYFANLELHKGFSGAFGDIDLFTFVDHGMVFSTSPAQVSLTAVGLGASYSYNGRITLEVTAGAPVGTRLPGQPDFAVFGRVIGRVF